MSKNSQWQQLGACKGLRISNSTISAQLALSHHSRLTEFHKGWYFSFDHLENDHQFIWLPLWFLHQYVHSFNHWLIHSLIHSFFHSFMHLSIHSCIHSFTFSFFIFLKMQLNFFHKSEILFLNKNTIKWMDRRWPLIPRFWPYGSYCLDA